MFTLNVVHCRLNIRESRHGSGKVRNSAEKTGRGGEEAGRRRAFPEDSLKAFEEGVKQAAFCTGKLNEAEKRVEILLKQKDGGFAREAFRPEENS